MVRIILTTAHSRITILVPTTKEVLPMRDIVNSKEKKKKCLVCYKLDCLSTNHSISEIKESKKIFYNKHLEYKKK